MFDQFLNNSYKSILMSLIHQQYLFFIYFAILWFPCTIINTFNRDLTKVSFFCDMIVVTFYCCGTLLLTFVIFLHLIMVIRNGKIVWKHGLYCWYFHLNLKYLGWSYRGNFKTAKSGVFFEELLTENDFDAVLATFCCYYNYGANAPEAVQKIATDQKEYHKCSSCVCLLGSQNISINNSEKMLVTRTPPM